MRALITGASLGIGRALALRLARDGARLVLSARDGARLEDVASEVRAAGGEAHVVASDVTKKADRVRLVEETRAALGGLDALVNNAGRGYYGAVRDIDVDEMPELFALNVFAPMHLTQLALPELTASHGTVVMVSSIAGVAAAPKMAAYAATKFALEAVSLSFRAELKADGVNVLVVRPGPVDTPFRENSIAHGVRAGVRTKGAKVQTAEDVAERTVRAIGRRASVLETSSYVKVASFGARAVPPIFRAVTAHMAKSR